MTMPSSSYSGPAITSPPRRLDDRRAAAAEDLGAVGQRHREVVRERASAGCTAAPRPRTRRTRSRCAASRRASRRCRRPSARPRSAARPGRRRQRASGIRFSQQMSPPIRPSGVVDRRRGRRPRRPRGRAARASSASACGACAGARRADQEQRVVERPGPLGLALVDADRAVHVVRRGTPPTSSSTSGPGNVDRARPQPLPQLVEAGERRRPACAQALDG